MAVIIHREIKDEQVVPLARLIGAINYADFVQDKDKEGKTVTIPNPKVPSFEEHLTALQSYFGGHFDRDLNGYLNQLVQEDPEVKAKREELEALINTKKG